MLLTNLYWFMTDSDYISQIWPVISILKNRIVIYSNYNRHHS